MASGLIPIASAFSLLINTKAAAPSFMVEALAAVTVPSLVKAGFSSGILSNFTLNASSSFANFTASPFRCSISTGTTSASKYPLAHAAWLRW